MCQSIICQPLKLWQHNPCSLMLLMTQRTNTCLSTPHFFTLYQKCSCVLTTGNMHMKIHFILNDKRCLWASQLIKQKCPGICFMATSCHVFIKNKSLLSYLCTFSMQRASPVEVQKCNFIFMHYTLRSFPSKTARLLFSLKALMTTSLWLNRPNIIYLMPCQLHLHILWSNLVKRSNETEVKQQIK